MPRFHTPLHRQALDLHSLMQQAESPIDNLLIPTTQSPKRQTIEKCSAIFVFYAADIF